jgi:hypothetical protein
MALRVARLEETWFSILNLSALDIEAWRQPPVTRNAVVNAEANVLFVQLQSSNDEMKDGYYRYLLQVGNILHLVAWHEGRPRLLRGGLAKVKHFNNYYGYPLDPRVETVAVEAAKVLYAENSGSMRTSAVLGPDEQSIVFSEGRTDV